MAASTIGPHAQVTPLELFFDLLFVFAFTQVTGLLVADPTWAGMLRGLLVLAVLWWTWTGYARLTNKLDPEQDRIRILMLAAVAAMLIMTLALPHVFGDDGITFALGYLVLRCVHLALIALAEGGDAPWQRGVLHAAPNVAGTSVALLMGSRLHGTAQIVCWVIAAALSYAWPLLGHARGWEISPEHFVERFGLVILIALGESVVALGAGARDRPLGAAVIIGALLGMAVVACLWWAYFDWVAYIVAARLTQASGQLRATLARDAYGYLHSAMVAGIVLFAYGVDSALQDTTQPLRSVPATGLAGGVALYFLAHVALRLRIRGGLGRGRPVTAALATALIPLATTIAALAALAALALLAVALIAYEVLRHRDARAAIRTRR